jgi:hypothetical protein
MPEKVREEDRPTEDDIARRKLDPRGIPGAPDKAKMTPQREKKTPKSGDFDGHRALGLGDREKWCEMTRPRKSQRRIRRSIGRLSARVTRESDALDLKRGVFAGNDPERIAASLKRSAERSHRRKGNPYRSALSMLTFYINRAGKTLPATKRKTLERAKVELRKKFNRRGKL